MTSVSLNKSTASKASVAEVVPGRLSLRLRLKPNAPVTGHVDGGWWPRSRDLAAELPSLLEVLKVRLGRIERVTYNLLTWPPVQRKITVGDVVVRVGGFRNQHADTLVVYGARREITLLVVPPQTAPETAHEALMAAGRRGDTAEIADLLDPRSTGVHATVPRAAGPHRDDINAADEQWELDGGTAR